MDEASDESRGAHGAAGADHAPCGDRPVVVVDADLADLVPSFLARRRAEAGVIRERLAHGDLEAVRVIGHSLKGTAGGYGFARLSVIGAALEAAAEAADAGAATRCADDIEAFLARVEVVFGPPDG